MKFILLNEFDPVELSLAVNKYLENGWCLFGSTEIVKSDEHIIHYQPMICLDVPQENKEVKNTSANIRIDEIAFLSDCLSTLNEFGSYNVEMVRKGISDRIARLRNA
jgi:hypothetical protein